MEMERERMSWMNNPAENAYLPDSPYPGIDPYAYAHRNVFFARETEARKLIRLVVQYRGVLLYSDSGTGKSSLINAGLIPLAMEEGFRPERIRVQPRKGEEFVVERLSSEISGKRRLLPSVFSQDDDHERIVLSAETFLETPRTSACAVRPILIFDQFEEWITLFEESAAGQESHDARTGQERIRDAIIALINDSTLPVKVLIALREDYLAKLTPFFQRCPSLPDQYLRLNPLSGEQIYKAIRGPFDRYPGKYRPELEPELAMEIKNQFVTRSSGSDISLTEVQIVCQSLFESGKEGKDLEMFFTGQGGVKGILEHYLEQRLGSLPSGQQEPAIALLTRMVTCAGTRNVISRDDLLRRVELEDGIQPEALAEALDNMEQNTKLLRRERRREVYFYEIASEFLVEWIRNKALEWQRKMDRKKAQGQLEEAQRQIKEAQRRIEEQRRTARRFRRFTIALVILSLLLVAAALTAWKMFGLARKQARIALSRQLAAQSLLQMDAKFDLALLLSIEATRIADTFESRTILLSALQRNPRLIRFFHGHKDAVLSIAFSPDGTRLASASWDTTIRLWDAATGKPLGEPLTGHKAEVSSVAFSPDGTRLASASWDTTIRLWDAATGKPLGQPLTGHEDTVWSVAFSPDGMRLASASNDTTIRLWDAATGKPLGEPLHGHKYGVSSVAFSPDGTRLAA